MATDVAIVGGGFAGLVTAVRATELGLTPLVLEKGSDSLYPCNSRYSGGNVHIGSQDMTQDSADLLAHVNEITDNFVDPKTATAMVGSSKRALEWIRGHGAKLLRVGSGRNSRWVMAPPRQAKPGLQWVGRGPDNLLRALTKALNDRGGKIVLNTKAVDLEMREGRCVGIHVEGGGVPRLIEAPAVVLADGGFQSDLTQVKKYICKTPDRILQRGAANGAGDGLRMCEKVGARLAGMQWFYGHPLSRDAFTNELLTPHPYLDCLAFSGIVVNAKGRRFIDEGQGGVWLANNLARLEDPLETMVIFDEDIWNGPGANLSSPPAPNPSVRDAGGTIHSANTIAELARLAGVPPDALTATVAAYNDAVAGGACEGLSPARTTKRNKAFPILKAPFHAAPICAGITYTMGGPAVDSDGRVQHQDGYSIENLYAVGSCAGGLEGGERIGYFGGIAKAIILGLHSAEHIARGKQVR